MTPFLQLVAQDLTAKIGLDFSRTVIVFPNKRAGLFMNDYLLQCAGGAPLWAPTYTTISELFHSFLPDWDTNDPIDTTLRIVTLFSQLTGQDVSVDWFYGWAERILSDFDDVDKNLADAAQLFQNVYDWKQYDDTTFLSEEQVEELRRFFSEFNPEQKSEVRERYQQLWDVLHDIYVQLNQQLAADRLGYEGALYRRVVEMLKSGKASLNPEVDHYVIVGFNVLDRVEQSLFDHLQREGKALFYWDYDVYYSNTLTHEAGKFLRENLQRFPCQLTPGHYDNLSRPKDIHMVEASTDAIQAQYVAPWLQAHLTPDPKRTAVVICNETLLQPVLHGIPSTVTELNVTKGFPLSHTEVATFVEHRLNDWERHKTNRPVVELLSQLSELVSSHAAQFVAHEGFATENFEDVLQSEAYYTMYTILNRFTQVMERHAAQSQLSLVTLRRLIRSVVRQATIPFHGEPAQGLQVMGVLETRCLDFDNIIMLSVNDGVLPKKSNDNSFIPLFLRRAFELTTPERRTAVYAYYFYRLLQRAQHVTMSYNTSTDGMSTGEMSRFMTQLLVEWPYTIQHHSLSSRQQTFKGQPAPVTKPHDLLQRLVNPKYGSPTLSPSALKTYLECQLRFYYQRVMGIREPDDTSGEIRPNVFGSIFHSAAEYVYRPLLKADGRVSKDHLLHLVAQPATISDIVRRAFAEQEVEYQLLVARVIEYYLVLLLRHDAQNADFDILGTELQSFCYVDATSGEQPVKVRINGTVDRIDFLRTERYPGVLRVLDYKTGSATAHRANDSEVSVEAAQVDCIDDIFAPGGKKAYMLQTYLYYLMLCQTSTTDPKLAEYLKHPVMPALFFIRLSSNPHYNPSLMVGNEYVTDVRQIADEMNQHINALVSEILDPRTPFLPTETAKTCQHCPYRGLCFDA